MSQGSAGPQHEPGSAGSRLGVDSLGYFTDLSHVGI